MIQYTGKKGKLITEYSLQEYKETMGSSKCSDGTRVTTSVCESRIRKAKEEKIEKFKDEHGYLFCEDCLRNDCIPVDCSHNISVDKAKKSGQTELCWSVENITLRGRPCHKKHDRL